MTREDLVAINANIVGGVVKEVVKHSPNCIIIMMTNPLDTMTYLAYKLSGFPRERVIGQAGVLDGGRMKTFIAMETGLDPETFTPPCWAATATRWCRWRAFPASAASRCPTS